jgi:hypothetical protein
MSDEKLTQDGPGRRHFLQAMLAMTPLAALPAAAQTPVASEDFPKVELVYTANVSVSPAQTVGETIQGTQRIIPITGGSFQGPKIRGSVIPGGADWNLARKDGANAVEAYYFLKTDDGVILKIVNKGIMPAPAANATAAQRARPRFTIPVFEAPVGKYDWLNTGAFVGTLKVLPGNIIQIGVFQVV